MTKWIAAAALMITAALAGTSDRPTPQAATSEEVATGTCSYTCSTNGVTYINRTRCTSACAGVCVVEAC